MFSIYNSRNYIDLLAAPSLPTFYSLIYNSRNYIDLLAKKVIAYFSIIYNSRNYIDLLAGGGVEYVSFESTIVEITSTY